jgi:hypothetical protein
MREMKEKLERMTKQRKNERPAVTNEKVPKSVTKTLNGCLQDFGTFVDRSPESIMSAKRCLLQIVEVILRYPRIHMEVLDWHARLLSIDRRMSEFREHLLKDHSHVSIAPGGFSLVSDAQLCSRSVIQDSLCEWFYSAHPHVSFNDAFWSTRPHVNVSLHALVIVQRLSASLLSCAFDPSEAVFILHSTVFSPEAIVTFKSILFAQATPARFTSDSSVVDFDFSSPSTCSSIRSFAMAPLNPDDMCLDADDDFQQRFTQPHEASSGSDVQSIRVSQSDSDAQSTTSLPDDDLVFNASVPTIPICTVSSALAECLDCVFDVDYLVSLVSTVFVACARASARQTLTPIPEFLSCTLQGVNALAREHVLLVEYYGLLIEDIFAARPRPHGPSLSFARLMSMLKGFPDLVYRPSSVNKITRTMLRRRSKKTTKQRPVKPEDPDMESRVPVPLPTVFAGAAAVVTFQSRIDGLIQSRLHGAKVDSCFAIESLVDSLHALFIVS